MFLRKEISAIGNSMEQSNNCLLYIWKKQNYGKSPYQINLNIFFGKLVKAYNFT